MGYKHRNDSELTQIRFPGKTTLILKMDEKGVTELGDIEKNVLLESRRKLKKHSGG